MVILKIMMRQAVLSLSEEKEQQLTFLEPSTFRAPGSTIQYELRLGSQDLVRLASFASANQFVVAGFMISDIYLNQLPVDEEKEISDTLVDILYNYGIEELSLALDDEYQDCYISGLKVISKSSGRQITFRRWGFIETSAISESEDLLRSAWQELDLS